jgi:DNA-binding NarL/FixJ family response regulator
MQRRIRILVANRRKLMRELILETLADQSGVEIVGEVAEGGNIMASVEETRPDFLFMTLDDPETRPSLCDSVLRIHPAVNIIAVGPHHDHGIRYWASFDIHSSAVEGSVEAILAVMKTAFAGETS